MWHFLIDCAFFAKFHGLCPDESHELYSVIECVAVSYRGYAEYHGL